MASKLQRRSAHLYDRMWVSVTFIAHSPGVGLTTHSSVRNQIESPLLRLPLEIRQIIFAYALDSATFFFNWRGPSGRVRADLHLPQVCRQIHCETKHMVDSFLYVSLDGDACICTWSTALDQQGCDLGSVIEVRLLGSMTAQIDEWVKDHGRWLADKLHQQFPSLRRVICESSEVLGDKNESIRRLFGKADLQVVYIEI